MTVEIDEDTHTHLRSKTRIWILSRACVPRTHAHAHINSIREENYSIGGR